VVNSKCVYRIYVEEKLVMRRRQRKRRICAQARVLLAAPTRSNETWTMDFLQDALAKAARYGLCRSKMPTRGSSLPLGLAL